MDDVLEDTEGARCVDVDERFEEGIHRTGDKERLLDRVERSEK
jgi:hypothetical protein